jgi:predicted PurR-regulated permease PerM
LETPKPKLERTLGLSVLVLLLAGCFLVLKPFVSALLWAIVLSFSLWPLHRRLVSLLAGRRTLASALMACALILLVLLPFVVIGITLADNVEELRVATQKWLAEGPPSPPSWLAKVPLIGPTAVEEWQALAADTSTLYQKAKPMIESVSLWLLKSGVALGRGLVELALSILISFFLWRDGLALRERLNVGIQRIAGPRGERLLEVAGNTVRGVVYGIIGTALIQSILAGIGYLIAGVPGVAVLTLVTFGLCIVPAVGAPMVWIPAGLWLFSQGATGRAIFLIIWGIAVSSVDNFVKPWLISHGSNLPFLLVFFGALGGLVAFGFIGLFIGPTLLAVGYKLMQEWLSSEPLATPSSTTVSVPPIQPAG